MGRAALLLVFGSILAVGYSQMTSNRSLMESENQEASYEQKVLAREIARSGFNLVVSRVRTDFSTHRGTWADNTYADGSYDVSAAGGAAGPVDVASIGYYGGFEHEISGILTQVSSRVLDATTFAADELKVEIKDDILISGEDVNPDGSPGSAEDTHAVLIPDANAYDVFLDKYDVDDNQITGLGPDPDFVLASPEASLTAVLEEIEAATGSEVYEYGDSDAKLKEMTMGSAESPVVIRAKKVELGEDFVGYGIILAREAFKMEKNARFEGLVYVVHDKAKAEFTDQAILYGSLVVRALVNYEDADQDDAGLPGGHFDVDVFEAPDWDKEIYHQHQFDDKFDVTGVDLLNPSGCGSQGLCWDDVMPSQKAAFVEFANVLSSDGTYSITADASSGPVGVPAVNLIGNPRDGLSATLFDASEITNFTVNFSQLCVLMPTSPGNVQKEPVSRDGSFSVKIYDADGPMGGPYTQGDLVYELAIYHHDNGGEQCVPSGGGGDPPEVVYTPGEKAEIKIEKDAIIQYSASALSAAAGIFAPSADPGSGEIKLTNIYETTREITP